MWVFPENVDFPLTITTYKNGVRGLLPLLYLGIFEENVFNLYSTIVQKSTSIFIVT